MKLRIKYCGGCNPNINRSQLAQNVINRLEALTDVAIVSDQADVGLILGGCSVCCVNKAEIETQALNWVVVGGNMVDAKEVAASQLTDLVCRHIMEKAGLVS